MVLAVLAATGTLTTNILLPSLPQMAMFALGIVLTIGSLGAIGLYAMRSKSA